MDFTPATLLSSNGASADIYFIGDRVYKLFRSKAHPRWGGGDTSEACARTMFRSELAAWRIVQDHESMRAHTPGFHGQVDIKTIQNPLHYLLDCCYEIDRVEGRAVDSE